MSDIDAIKRKVRGLLAMAAEGSGATEPERATARRLADQLMAQHGLTEADVPEREVARPQPLPPPVQPAGPVFVIINPVSFGFRFTQRDSTNDWSFSGF